MSANKTTGTTSLNWGLCPYCGDVVGTGHDPNYCPKNNIRLMPIAEHGEVVSAPLHKRINDLESSVFALRRDIDAIKAEIFKRESQ
jgi:hypothetical protein